jgi:hypothetical protein
VLPSTQQTAAFYKPDSRGIPTSTHQTTISSFQVRKNFPSIPGTMDLALILNPCVEVTMTDAPASPIVPTESPSTSHESTPVSSPKSSDFEPRVLFECEDETCQAADCPEVFRTAHALALHTYQEHKTNHRLLFKLAPALRVECACCNEIFTSLSNLKKHLKWDTTRSSQGSDPNLEAVNLLTLHKETVRRG